MKNVLSLTGLVGTLLICSNLTAEPARCSDCERQGPDRTAEIVLASFFQAAQSILSIAFSEDPYDKELLQKQSQTILQSLAAAALTAVRTRDDLVPEQSHIHCCPELALSFAQVFSQYRAELLDLCKQVVERCGRDDCPHGDRPEKDPTRLPCRCNYLTQ